MRHTPRGTVVAALGTAQTLAWASSYYLPAMLAAPMARELGLGTPAVFAAFSLALVVSALVAPAAGRLIDRHGGRPVLALTSVLFALGLAWLGLAQGPWSLFAAWALIGVAMGSGLYEAGFATLVRLYGNDSRNTITGITLIAGLASTVGWPLSAWMEVEFGWRGACAGWALLHLVLGLPLNLSLPRVAAAHPEAAHSSRAAASIADATRVTAQPQASPPSTSRPAAHTRPDAKSDTATATATAPATATALASVPPPLLTSVLLAYVFAAAWFVSTAMASHLPRLLEAYGASLAAAVGIAALVGPSQVAGRLLEFGLLRRLHPLLSARLATLAHPLGALVLGLGGAALAPVFAVLHGAGNGILTIAKGTLPLALFGPAGYGERQGWLMLPARLAQAAAPLAFDVVLQRLGTQSLWLSALLTLSAFAALMLLRAQPAPAASPRASP